MRKQNNRITIPVVIDDVKSIDNFQMSRCIYFSIQCDNPSIGWELGLGKSTFPFIMLGLSGIIYKPIGNSKIFNKASHFKKLFEEVEANDDVYIDMNDIWLPNHILTGDYRKRGYVFRIDSELFLKAYEFINKQIGQEEFDDFCKKLDYSPEYSKPETFALDQFEKQTIGEIKEAYHENKGQKLPHKKAK